MRPGSWAIKHALAAESGQGELFDPPEMAPVWPTAGTLPDMALTILLSGHSLDHREFYESSGSWRLASVIHKLHCLGWPVLSNTIPDPTEMALYRTIAVYYLPARFVGNLLQNNRSFS